MRHIIDLCDLTEKEFSDLYKLVSNIIDRPEGYVDACRRRGSHSHGSYAWRVT